MFEPQTGHGTDTPISAHTAIKNSAIFNFFFENGWFLHLYHQSQKPLKPSFFFPHHHKPLPTSAGKYCANRRQRARSLLRCSQYSLPSVANLYRNDQAHQADTAFLHISRSSPKSPVVILFFCNSCIFMKYQPFPWYSPIIYFFFNIWPLLKYSSIFRHYLSP